MPPVTSRRSRCRARRCPSAASASSSPATATASSSPTCIDSIKAQTLTAGAGRRRRRRLRRPGDDRRARRARRGPRVEVIRQEVNRGPSAARNRALAVLETSYMLPIDADDKLLPDALERMLAQLERGAGERRLRLPPRPALRQPRRLRAAACLQPLAADSENYCPAPGALRSPGVRRGRGPLPRGDRRRPRGLGPDPAARPSGASPACHADGPTFLYRRQGFSRVNAVDYGPPTSSIR